ncbi:hypothetical protein QYM36_003295, partial [Artemia franciscana]
VIKSVNFNNCRNSPVFNMASPPGWKCKPGAASCQASQQRSSVGRYIACGSLNSFTLVSLVHHGAFISNPYAVDTERLEAHTLQKLRLQTTRQITETFPNTGSMVPLRSLNFAFAPETPGAPKLTAPHVHDVERSLRTLTFAQIRSQITNLLQETTHDIRTAEDLAARSAIDRVAAISEALGLLDYSELGQLASEITGISFPSSLGREPSDIYGDARNIKDPFVRFERKEYNRPDERTGFGVSDRFVSSMRDTIPSSLSQTPTSDNRLPYRRRQVPQRESGAYREPDYPREGPFESDIARRTYRKMLSKDEEGEENSQRTRRDIRKSISDSQSVDDTEFTRNEANRNIPQAGNYRDPAVREPWESFKPLPVNPNRRNYEHSDRSFNMEGSNSMPNPTRRNYEREERPFERRGMSVLSTEPSELFMDALMASGSNPAISLILELVNGGHISGTRAIQGLATLPLVLRTPSREILQKLVRMSRTLSTKTERALFYSSLLSTSTLLRMACVNQTEAKARFPTTLYGPFCSPSDPLIVAQFIPLLSHTLRKDSPRMDKFVALTALGNLGHPGIMPVLIPVIEGQVDSSINVRTKAVISLHKLVQNENQRASQILLSVYQNPSEHYQVRIAAFILLILGNPPIHRWQEFAISTWFERDMQVASFVYTTLKSLSAMKDPVPAMVEPSEKAYAVLSIARPIPWNFHYSRNVILSGQIHANRIGATLFTEIFGSQETVLPRHVYTRLNWCLGSLSMDSVEMELYGLHMPGVWDKISSVFAPATEPMSSRDYTRDIMHERGSARVDLNPLYAELRRIRERHETMSVSSNNESEGFLHLVLMESVAAFVPLDVRSVESTLRGMMSANRALAARLPVSMTKWMPLMDLEVIIPDPLGFAVTVRTKAHSLLSLRGHLASSIGAQPEAYALPNWSTSTNSFNLDVDVNPTVIAKVVSKISINAGFTMVKATSGVDTHSMISLPGHFSLRVDMSNFGVALAWNAAATTPEGVDKTLFHFHVRPFTGMQSVHDLSPVTSVQVSTEILALGETLHENLRERDISVLGFGLRIIERSETPLSLESMWDFIGPKFNLAAWSTMMWIPSSIKRKLIKISYISSQDPSQIMIFVNNTMSRATTEARGNYHQRPTLRDTVPRGYPHSVPPIVPGGPPVRPIPHPSNKPSSVVSTPKSVLHNTTGRPGSIGPVSPNRSIPGQTNATVNPKLPIYPAPTVHPTYNISANRPAFSTNTYNRGFFADYASRNLTSGVNVDLYILNRNKATFRFFLGGSNGETGRNQAFHMYFSNQDSTTSATPFEICFDAETRLPVETLDRMQPLSPNYDTSDAISFNASVGFGRTCDSYSFKINGTAVQSPSLKRMIREALTNRRCGGIERSWQRWNERQYNQGDGIYDYQGRFPENPAFNTALPNRNYRTGRALKQSNFNSDLEQDHIRSPPRQFYRPPQSDSDFIPTSSQDSFDRHEDFIRPEEYEGYHHRRPFRNPEYRGSSSESYGGLPNACKIAKEWSSLLDVYNITADLSTLPHFAVNASNLFGQYFNRFWVPYYSYTGGVPGSVHMVIKTHPLTTSEFSAADISIYTPRSNASFVRGKLPEWMNLFLPITRTPSLTKAFFGDSFSPVCTLEDGTVTTFDGVTYEGELTDCNHILVSNSQRRFATLEEREENMDHFAVLAKRRGAKKVFTLLFGTNEIFVGPISENGPAVFRINGVNLNFGTNTSVQIPLATHGRAVLREMGLAELLNDGSLRITVPGRSFEMVTNGNVAQIKVSPMLRGQLAGMCGNWDNQPGTSELRGPDGCALSSGQLFASSYAIQDGRCTGISDATKSELRREQANCQRSDYLPSQVSHFSQRMTAGQEPGSCNILKTLVVYKDDKKCFSTQPVVDCKAGCDPQSQAYKNIGFHCASGRLGTRLEEEALNRPLTEMSGRPETFRTTLNVPTSCVPSSRDIGAETGDEQFHLNTDFPNDQFLDHSSSSSMLRNPTGILAHPLPISALEFVRKFLALHPVNELNEIIGIGEQTILVSPLNNQGDNNSEQYDHHVNNTSFSTPQSQ